MCGAGVTNILHGTAQYFQASVEHLSLDKTCSSVIFSMEDDQRGGDILYVRDG